MASDKEDRTPEGVTVTLALEKKIIESLSDDLRLPKYRDGTALRGHCYLASEVLYHISGGKSAGLKAVRVRHQGDTHWWIRDASGCDIDLTASQFDEPPPYDKGVPTGFLTKKPSKRAQKLIERITG